MGRNSRLSMSYTYILLTYNLNKVLCDPRTFSLVGRNDFVGVTYKTVTFRSFSSPRLNVIETTPLNWTRTLESLILGFRSKLKYLTKTSHISGYYRRLVSLRASGNTRLSYLEYRGREVPNITPINISFESDTPSVIIFVQFT